MRIVTVKALPPQPCPRWHRALPAETVPRCQSGVRQQRPERSQGQPGHLWCHPRSFSRCREAFPEEPGNASPCPERLFWWLQRRKLPRKGPRGGRKRAGGGLEAKLFFGPLSEPTKAALLDEPGRAPTCSQVSCGGSRAAAPAQPPRASPLLALKVRFFRAAAGQGEAAPRGRSHSRASPAPGDAPVHLRLFLWPPRLLQDEEEEGTGQRGAGDGRVRISPRPGPLLSPRFSIYPANSLPHPADSLLISRPSLSPGRPGKSRSVPAHDVPARPAGSENSLPAPAIPSRETGKISKILAKPCRCQNPELGSASGTARSTRT
ncbi:translation initiation factor IF-2-like [Parus major]|uniref:translation initiation factor IF-2-like n=1 Tax=Parus major TaxID=9157 RepID=UPI001443F066|nr:translation initiation factor IF-2-like [Parus major]